MKQFKRTICAILAFVLTAASFCSGLALNTTATGSGVKTPDAGGINLMDNAGFENSRTSLQNWGYNAPVTVNTDAAFTHGGSVSAKVAAGASEEAYAYCNTTVSYNLNAAVTAGIWVYLSDAADAQNVTLFLERPESTGGTVTTKPAEMIGWQKVELTGGATEKAIRHAIKFVVAPENQGDIYFDDAFLYTHDRQSVNLIRNGGFDVNKDTWADASVFEIAKDVFCSGTGSAKITGQKNMFQATGWWPNKTSADGSKTLYYSVWVKGGENAGTVTLRAEVKGSDIKNYYSETVTGKTEDWHRLVVEIPAQQAVVQEILFHITTTGTGVFYADDACLSDIPVSQQLPEEEEPEGDKISGTVNTEEEGENLIKNAGFEESTGSLAQWSQEGALVNTDQAFTHSGTVSGKVRAGITGVVYPYQVINTKAYQSAFRAGIWVYLTNAADATKVKLFLETGNGNALICQAAPQTGWQKIVVQSPAGGNRSNFVMKLEVQAGVGADVYFDDAFFMLKSEIEEPTEPTEPINPAEPTEPEETTAPEQTNVLRNPGLEELNGDGSITHWDVWPGNPADGVRQYEVVSDAHSGDKAVKITAVSSNPHAIYQYCVEPTQFDFAQSYRASVWVKLEDVSVTALTFGIKRRDAKNAEHNLYTKITQGTTDGWVQVTLDVPGLTGTELAQFDVIVDIGAGSGSVYLDDFSLVPADIDPVAPQKPQTYSGILRNPGLETLNADGSVLDWDVWPGDPAEGVRQYEVVRSGVHGGRRALMIEAVQSNAHAVYQYCTNRGSFDFSGSYRVSVWVKLEDVDVSVLTLGVKRKNADGTECNLYTDIPQGTTDGWVQVTLDVPGLLNAELTQFDVIVDIGSGTGKVYLDDFSLVYANIPKVEMPKEGDSILRNPSLEALNPDGSVLHWDVWPGDPAEGNRDYEVVSDTVHSGNRAVKINLLFSNGQAIYQYCVDPDSFDFTADYIATVWVKTENMTIYDGTGATLGVKRTDTQGNVHVITTAIPTGTSADWVQVKLEVPAYENLEVVQYDIVVDVGAGSGCIYLDDFDLISADLEDLPNPNSQQEDEEADPNEGKLELVPDNGEQPKNNGAVVIVVTAAVLVLIMVSAAVIVIIRRKIKT